MASNLPIYEPSLELADVTDETTYFDTILAAPPLGTLRGMWLVTVALAPFVLIVCTLVFMAILSKRSLRKSPFNFYLLFLLFPDIVVAILCTFSCFSNALVGGFTSEFLCKFQSFYVIFSIGANAWMNAFIAHAVHDLLRAAAGGTMRQHYLPPDHSSISVQGIGCYIWASMLALLPIVEELHMPLEVRVQRGAACLPHEYDREGVFFKYLIFIPLLAGIPFLYITYVASDIYFRQLIRKSGSSRALAVYVFRIIFVFYVMWIPTVVFFIALGTWVPVLLWWLGAQWVHVQGLGSTCVILMNEEVRSTALGLVCINGHSVSGDEEDITEKGPRKDEEDSAI